MRLAIAGPIAAVVMLGGIGAAFANGLERQVKVEIASTEVHPGMAPGTYVCAAGHLHIKGTVHNTASVAVGPVKVAGKVLDAEGKVLGTATASTKSALNPDGKAAVDLEFLTVTGPKIDKVKHQELSVVAVGSNP